MNADAQIPSEHESPKRRRGGVPHGLKVYDSIILGLILAAALTGIVVFGAVRFWIFGALYLAVFLAMTLFFLRPLFYPEIRRIHIPPGFVFGLLFLIYAAVRIPFSASPYEARVEWLAIFSCLGAYWVLADVAGAGRRWKVAVGLLLGLITIVAWYMIIQHANGSRMVLWMERPPGYGMRASGTFHCPNHVAQLLGLGLTLGLALVMAPGAGTWLRILGAYVLIIVPYPLALTQSRAGFIGAGAGVAVTGLLAAWRKGARYLVLAIIVIPLLLGAAGAALWTFSPENRERIQAAMRFESAGRIAMWQGTIELIKERPVFGHGGNNYRFVQDRHQVYSGHMKARFAHNEFLHATADYGFVGFGLLTLFFGVGGLRVLARFRTMERSRDIALTAGLLGVVAGKLAHNFFDFTFHLYANALVFALVAGVVVSVLFGSAVFAPAFPPRRFRRLASVILALVCAGAFVWSAFSWASVLHLFPARRAHENMEDRRAEVLYRRAIRLDAGNWRPYLELANVIRDQSFWNPNPEKKQELAREAELLYRRCLELNPWQYDARFGLSRLYNQAGNYERALEELQEIVRKSPRNGSYHTAIGRQLLRMNRPEEALEAFRTAVSCNPRDEVARANIRSLRRRGIQ